MPNFISQDTVTTRYWHALDDGRIQCDLCPRFCKLHEGQRGLCFIRQNLDNQIVMTSYGRSSGFAIDPIEKKPLNHFLHSFFRHGRLQSGLQVLPELGHQQITGNGFADEPGVAGKHCSGGFGAWLYQRSLHLQRPCDFP